MATIEIRDTKKYGRTYKFRTLIGTDEKGVRQYFVPDYLKEGGEYEEYCGNRTRVERKIPTSLPISVTFYPGDYTAMV